LNDNNDAPHISADEASFLRVNLNSQSGLHINYVAAKLGMPINLAAKTFLRLQSLSFLRIEENILYITPQGRRWVMENQHFFSHSGPKPWRQIPDRFKGNRIEAFQPYAPRRPRLSKKDFGIDQ